MKKFENVAAGGEREQGMALIPALMVVSMLAILGLSMLTAGLDGAKSVNYQSDEYKLTSAVESVGILAVESLWSDYLADPGQNGAPGDITSFRAFLTTAGIADEGPGDPPEAAEGFDMKTLAGIPLNAGGDSSFDNVNIDEMRIFRRDQTANSTQLYVTVSASTNRGQGIVNPVLNRAIQMVYTIEPENFEGFDYGILANNVNCIFCHAQVDSVERYFNTDPNNYGSFDRVKVGTLESLQIRHEWNIRPELSDWDADSRIAGSLYVRGTAIDQFGDALNNWEDATLRSFGFDADGHVLETGGMPTVVDFAPSAAPHGPGENLYLDYPTDYGQMPDGPLPNEFPPPFPDDGGIDLVTGAPTSAGAGNRIVDPEEFAAVARRAEGSVIAGIINLTDPSTILDTIPEYSEALLQGNQRSLQSGETGNVVLSGTVDRPIVIDGQIAIDGDLVINGYVQGEGSFLVSGNIYVPTDLHYLDGTTTDANGNTVRTFGIDAEGGRNALSLAAGGNILLGDYLKPASLHWSEEDGFWNENPGQYEIISGSPNDEGSAVGEWSFALAEMSLFNRREWAMTQEFLPGPGGTTVANPNYDPTYVPRYYQFGPNDEIPIYNLGDTYYDPATSSWHGDEEVPLTWDTSKLTLADPTNASDPVLYAADGSSIAAIAQITPNGGWLTDYLQKLAIEYFESRHTYNTPMEIDGLLYTNNAIFGIVSRHDVMRGQMIVNGSLICADLGLLTPGYYNPDGVGTPSNVAGGSTFATGVQINYDRRLKENLHVSNPLQITIKRTLWNPMANIL